MDVRNLVKTLGPLALLTLGSTLTACKDPIVSVNGERGKPLDQLDLSGAPPHGLALFGPDSVTITRGEKLAIHVDGDPAAAAQLRFTLKDGTLGILRQGHFGSGDSPVTVHVTMPAPEELTMAGSGTITAPALAGKASVTILGSGSIATPAIAPDHLNVSILGSGAYRAGGRASVLSLNIAGTGSADMAGLRVDTATVNVAGSGNSHFASDGKVSASMLGSGMVTVSGRAHCTVSALGSGKLVCQPGDGNGTSAASDANSADQDI